MTERSNAPRRRAGDGTTKPAGGAMARALLILAACFLPLGLLLPVLETTRLWVFESQYSLIDAVRALISEGEIVLGLVIALFSLLTPVLKFIAVTALHRRPAGSHAGPLARWVDHLGKWSLTDVLVVALIIVIYSGEGLRFQAQAGLWFFAASAICLMAASGFVVADLKARRESVCDDPSQGLVSGS